MKSQLVLSISAKLSFCEPNITWIEFSDCNLFCMFGHHSQTCQTKHMRKIFIHLIALDKQMLTFTTTREVQERVNKMYVHFESTVCLWGKEKKRGKRGKLRVEEIIRMYICVLERKIMIKREYLQREIKIVCLKMRERESARIKWCVGLCVFVCVCVCVCWTLCVFKSEWKRMCKSEWIRNLRCYDIKDWMESREKRLVLLFMIQSMKFVIVLFHEQKLSQTKDSGILDE